MYAFGFASLTPIDMSAVIPTEPEKLFSAAEK